MKTLKELQTAERKITEQLEINTAELKKINIARNNLINTLKQIQEQIKLHNSTLIVTEHAIVRYFERILDYNMETIKNEILPSKIQELLEGTHSFEYKTKDHIAVVKENKVVTILPRDGKK